MPRPKCCRQVGAMPDRTRFRPQGAGSAGIAEVCLTLDEYEALRLADLEGLYQEQAALQMNVSRQTFGRIVKAARRKVADVLVNGKALRIVGGSVSPEEGPMICCPRCRRPFGLSGNMPYPTICPHCRKQEGKTKG